MILKYDVIVIGGGHAGCEAACASANMGAKTCLVTMDMNKIAQMSCNPAVGGIAKGQIVREIDALGGMMGLVTDATAIQFRMLNRSKGPAMWSPRAQCDRGKFIWQWRSMLDNTPNLDIWQKQRHHPLFGVVSSLCVDHFGSQLASLNLSIHEVESGTFGAAHYLTVALYAIVQSVIDFNCSMINTIWCQNFYAPLNIVTHLQHIFCDNILCIGGFA